MGVTKIKGLIFRLSTSCDFNELKITNYSYRKVKTLYFNIYIYIKKKINYII